MEALLWERNGILKGGRGGVDLVLVRAGVDAWR